MSVCDVNLAVIFVYFIAGTRGFFNFQAMCHLSKVLQHHPKSSSDYVFGFGEFFVCFLLVVVVVGIALFIRYIL